MEGENTMPKCKDCGQEIKWVTMANGVKMPLDAKSVLMIQVKEGIGEVIPVYRTHFETCSPVKNERKDMKTMGGQAEDTKDYQAF